MLYVFKVVWWVLTAPVRLLWRAYLVLWWAFDDSERRAAGAPATSAPHGAPPPPQAAPTNPDTDAPRYPGQRTAFEVTDSTPPPAKPPTAMLRAGFVATAMGSLVLAGLLAPFAGDEVSPARAWVLWGMATVVGAIVSQAVVRHAAARAAARAHRGVWGRVRLGVGGAKDACVSGAQGVGRLCRTCVDAAKVTKNAAQKAACSTPATRLRAGCVKVWDAARRSVRRTPASAA